LKVIKALIIITVYRFFCCAGRSAPAPRGWSWAGGATAVRPATATWGWHRGVQVMHNPTGLNDVRSASSRAPASVDAVSDDGSHSKPSSPSQ